MWASFTKTWRQFSGSQGCQILVLALPLALLSLSSTAAENSAISLDLNDDAVRLAWSSIQPERKFRYDASVLHHQDRGTVIAGGFHITGNASTPQRPINAGLGGRVLYADTKDIDVTAAGMPTLTFDQTVLDNLPDSPLTVFDDIDAISLGDLAFPGFGAKGYAVAVGGFFDGKLPNYDRVGFGGHIYYAPELLSFGDMTEFTDIWLYGSYSVLKRGELYVGLRNVKAEFEFGGDFNFDTGLHIGMKLKF